MNCHAILLTDSKNAEVASQALNADNVRMERLNVSTHPEGGRVRTDVKVTSISTLISTIDDILSCQITSESMM